MTWVPARLALLRLSVLAAALLVPPGQSGAVRAQVVVPPPAAKATAPATAPSPPTTNTAAVDAEIDALLKQLGSDEWAARMAAQNRLAALGELAEARLQRAARESDDAEVRARCEAALQQIADGRLVGATLITMSVHQVSPRVAFEELGRQCGVELKPHDPSLWTMRQLPPVTLDVQREPFWQVVARLREQCNLDLEHAGTAGLVVMSTTARGPGQAPMVTHGPFRIRATRISRSYSVDLANAGGGGGGAEPAIVSDFVVMLSVQAEPKLKIASGMTAAKLDVAEDENGLSLLPVAGADVGAGAAGRLRGASEYAPRSGTAAWPVTARLHYPEQGAGKRIARLKGTASCSLIVRADTLELPDILALENVTREVAGTSVTIKRCRKVGNHYELSLSVTRDGFNGVAARASRGQGFSGVRLLDTTGRDMPQQGSSTSIQGDRMEMTLQYPAGPAPVPAAVPAKLIWQVPTELRDVEVPFEFSDLPLP